MNRPVVLITGAARRLGRGVALHLAERGFDLAITYRTPGPDVPSLVQAVERMGGRCVAIHVDLLGLPESIEKIANGVTKFAIQPFLVRLLHKTKMVAEGIDFSLVNCFEVLLWVEGADGDAIRPNRLGRGCIQFDLHGIGAADMAIAEILE